MFYVAKALCNSVLVSSIKIDGNSNLGLKPFSSKIWLDGLVLFSNRKSYKRVLLLPSVSTVFFIHSLRIYIQKAYYSRQFSTDGLYIADYKTLVSFEYLLLSPISMKQNSVLRVIFMCLNPCIIAS